MPTIASLNLGHLLKQRAQLSRSAEAIVAPTGRWTYAELYERASRLAAHLQQGGVGTGDRVAIYAKNGEFLATSLFAASLAGATAVVLNWRLQVAELEYILGDSGATTLLYEAHFSDAVRELHTRVSVSLSICSTGGSSCDAPYDAIVGTKSSIHLKSCDVFGDSSAIIMYTSGTTGRPKGAMISHNALIAGAVGNSSTLDWDRTHRFLLIAPMFHIGGLSPFITNVLLGCTTILEPDFDPAAVWKTITTERVTSMMTVPVMLHALLMVAKAVPVDLSSLKWVTCGASAVPPSLIDVCIKMGLNIQQVYGTTECGAMSYWTKEIGVEKATSHGLPLIGGQLKIVDPTTLEDVALGVDGEVLFRGPMVFSGYWGKPEATKSAMLGDWYRTGDIGRVDADGYLYVVDRLKDMIISGGENIYPAELEAVISAMPEVLEVAVVGKPDAKWGEVPVAFIACRPGHELKDDQVIAACKEKLASYKCVKAVEFVRALPRNPVGKILKQELRS